MSSFLKSLEAAGALAITRTVYVGGGGDRFLLFTRYSEADAQWLIG